MRNELKIIETIEKYLNNELSEADRKAFEEKLKNNQKLQEEVEKQRLIQEGVKNIGIRSKVTKAYKKFKLKKLGTNLGIVALVAVATTAAVYFSSSKSSEQEFYKENIKYEQNETGTNQWADADELIEPQFFSIDAEKDTVLTTKSGMVIAIPKGALLENGKPVEGNVEIEIKEAINPEDIVLSGLSSMSGDDLLETGGMFYFNARKNGNTLDIDPQNGVVIDVPTDNPKAGMQLYDGIRKEDGTIDWQNPKPIEQFLTTVDITTLDFYPPGYEKFLAEFGKGNKTKNWKDSLYYSFATNDSSFYVIKSELIPDWTILDKKKVLGITNNNPVSYDEEKAIKTESLTLDTIWENNYQINPAIIKTIWDKKFNNTLLATKEFEERLSYIFQTCDNSILELYINNIDKRLSTIDSMVVEELCGNTELPKPYANINNRMEGKKLFEQNCSACHKINEVSVGQNLAGARKKWAMAGEGHLIYEFISNPLELISSGKSQLAIEAANFSPTEMTPMGHLSKTQMDQILDYVDYMALRKSQLINSNNNNVLMDSAALASEDSIEAVENTRTPIDLCSKFKEFAAQNKGRVKMDNQAAEILSAYYSKQVKANAEALAKTQQEFWNNYSELIVKKNNADYEQSQKEQERLTQNFQEEYELNLTDAYRQLGIEKPKATLSKDKYCVSVTSPGWKNVDQAVFESLTNRETMNYTHTNGKTAVIKYESCKITIENADKYEKTFVYLMPRELNSFQRMKAKGEGVFEENLNELIQYQLVTAGMKDNKIFVSKIDELQPQSYTLSLEETPKKEFRKMLRKGNLKSVRNDVIDDIKYELEAMQMNKDKAEFEDMITFREFVKSVIFPCYEITSLPFAPGLLGAAE